MPQYSINGSEMQYLAVTLGEREKIYADGGHLLYKDSTVKMSTTLKGGLLSSLKRAITGGTFFVTEFEGPGKATFAGIFPGKIFEIDLDGSRTVLAESHSFLLAEEGVSYDAQMARIGAGILAGEGLFFAKFHGYGKLFLHAYGGLQELDLKEGEKVQVEAGHLLAFEDGMRYSVSSVGGIKSMLFAHEGWFFVQVEGPGKVYLHTVTAEQLARVIEPFIPRQGGSGVEIRL